MPPPEEPQELQKFLGMTTYLSPFIPSLSTFTAPLWELLRKDSEFTWNDSYQEAFNAVKQMVCKDTTLRYFDSRKPIVIQVDASQKGLGAALLQDGHPIAFASKALTPTEQRYANIEREMLACVFGAERFHTYVFGRSFTIESDHKPLEQINLKNLADTPARLQRMLLHLQNYDVKITYRPGREMLVADTLSRYTPMPAPEVALDLAIHHMHITPEKKLAFQQSIQDDPLLRSLAETIIAGWPEDIKDLPNALRPYHTYRDVMTVEDGLILCGEALIIPPSERGKVLESIHEGHLGISKCQFRARQCVYWPGINADIRKMVEACPTCQLHRPQESRQPLQSTPAPERPWQHLGADYFSFDGSEYLVIVDYYTKMPFVRKMSPSHCNSTRTIAVLKELFAEHGIPEVIWTDNGPQFPSHLFAEFTKDWNIDHTRSSPRNPRSNGQAESAVKIVKGLLTWAKFSGQDLYLALLAYRSTPVDAHLWSPAEMLYQCTIWTTVPQTKSPFYAGQTVSVLNDTKTLWLPATVIRQAAHGSYLVEVVVGGCYRRAHDHIRERHPDAVKKDDTPPGNVAPAMPEWPGAPPAHSPPAVPTTAPVAPTTTRLPAVPTAKTSTPRKTAARTPVHSPAPPTGVAQQQTGAAPAAPRRSTRATKPNKWLIEEMWPDRPWPNDRCWPRSPLTPHHTDSN